MNNKKFVKTLFQLLFWYVVLGFAFGLFVALFPLATALVVWFNNHNMAEFLFAWDKSIKPTFAFGVQFALFVMAITFMAANVYFELKGEKK